MSSSSGNIQSKLLHEGTHFCRCLELQPKTGELLGLTDHDKPILFRGLTYHADGGLLTSAVEENVDLSRDGLEFQGVLSSSYITETDLNKGVYDGAGFKIWLVDWQNPENALLLSRGFFGAVRRQDSRFMVNLEGPAAELQQKTGRIYQKDCDTNLGDTRCQVQLNKAKWQYNTELQEIDANRLSFPSVTDYVSGWFTHGYLQFTSGILNGVGVAVREDVVRQNQRLIVLWDNLPDVPAIGDAVTLTAGCDKQLSTCATKFNNVLNFQGIPYMPSDHLLVNAKG